VRLTVLVVAGAIVRSGRVLAAQRSYPAELADRWEFPGGKVEPGEVPSAALVREIREELGVDVVVHERLGDDVPLRLLGPEPGSQPSPVPGSQPSQPSPVAGSQPSPVAGSQPSPVPGSQSSPVAGSQSSPVAGSQPSPVAGRLRLYRCSLSVPDATPVAREHARLRWVGAPELDALGWLGTNRQLLPLVRAALAM
jgi:8-oxo-dGTP pyrophosphatase MutT (NUDIX family)